MATNIPFGVRVVLPDDPGESREQTEAAQTAFEAGQLDHTAYRERLNAVVKSYPTCLNAWAALGELSLPDDVIAAYAYFRTGYHRGLDRGRASGWNGAQQLPWAHESNRGFLRCLYGLMLAATEIDEASEATRTRDFLVVLDPDNHFGIEPSE